MCWLRLATHMESRVLQWREILQKIATFMGTVTFSLPSFFKIKIKINVHVTKTTQGSHSGVQIKQINIYQCEDI